MQYNWLKRAVLDTMDSGQWTLSAYYETGPLEWEPHFHNNDCTLVSSYDLDGNICDWFG